MLDTIKTKPRTGAAPMENGCWNCEHGDTRIGAQFVHCGVSLPPQVQISADSRRHMAGRQYICIFHKVKKAK